MNRVLSLFAGVGGIDLGLHWAGGFETVGWCEREPFCRRVMEHHWPGLWNHDDITTLVTLDLSAWEFIFANTSVSEFRDECFQVIRRACVEALHKEYPFTLSET